MLGLKKKEVTKKFHIEKGGTDFAVCKAGLKDTPDCDLRGISVGGERGLAVRKLSPLRTRGAEEVTRKKEGFEVFQRREKSLH